MVTVCTETPPTRRPFSTTSTEAEPGRLVCGTAAGGSAADHDEVVGAHGGGEWRKRRRAVHDNCATQQPRAIMQAKETQDGASAAGFRGASVTALDRGA